MSDTVDAAGAFGVAFTAACAVVVGMRSDAVTEVSGTCVSGASTADGIAGARKA
jgi:hypothetical protein